MNSLLANQAAGIVFALLVWVLAAEKTAAVEFLRDVQPVLAAHCSKCHGEGKQKGGLRLDQKAAALRGGDSGPAWVVGRPDSSELMRRVVSSDPETRMPQEGPRLSTTEIRILGDWIAAGAPWPDDPIAEAAERHWAFRPPVRPPLPERSEPGMRAAHPIDALLARKQIELGLQPLPAADRRTLIRRVTLDLTGLPPTPEEVDTFLADRSADAYEKVVERLLASPRHGERWGRFWLDLARWAESDGFEANELRSSAWRYRDYVVRAFNSDKPFDRFLREQIAGDELEPYADEHLIATGFLASGRSNNNEEDKRVQLNGPRVDMANTVASVTLGLTLQCAQCHDHKFEPLTIRDYYGLHGFFVGGQVNNLVLRDTALLDEWERSRPPELATARTLVDQLLDSARKRVSPPDGSGGATESPASSRPADAQLLAALSDDDRKLVESLRKKIKAQEQALFQRKPHVWAYYSPATSRHLVENLPPRGQYPFPYQPEVLKTNVALTLQRGDPHQPSERLTLGLPAVLDRRATNLTSRSQLVDWLVSDANPLTARVWVNYVWQQHFGRGLVETPGDFGLRGAPPVNQALLDWLAYEFRQPAAAAGASGAAPSPLSWSVRHLHRLIVTSAAYRRAAYHDAANARIDPDNRHLWRWEPRRLESEALRDSMLAVSGLLEKTIGGPSHPATNSANCRSLYLTQQRNVLPAAQRVFDAPAAIESCPRRHVSTVALQPLHLLNNAEMGRLARAFATCVEREAGQDPERQMERACRLALNRSPDDLERVWAMKFLSTPSSSKADEPPGTALFHFCQALLNLNEFAYLE